MTPTPDTPTPTSEEKPTLARLSFSLVILGAILIAVLLVVLSLYLYDRSGASQLDLSLPELQEERLKAQQMRDYDTFRSSGKLDDRALDYFERIYTKQQDTILEDHNGFSPEPLSDKTLKIQVE